MNCANAICSLGTADWYLDFTGWRGPLALAAVALVLALAGAHAYRRRVGR